LAVPSHPWGAAANQKSRRYLAGSALDVEMQVPDSRNRLISVNQSDDRCPECNGRWTTTEAQHKLGCRKAITEQKVEEKMNHEQKHGHSHDEIYTLDTETGSCEISIFEKGVPPEFRIKFKGAPPPANDVTVKTDRGNNSVDIFTFEWDSDLGLLRSTKDIPEPHEFLGEVTIAGHTKTYTFDQKEIDEEAHTLAHKIRTLIYVTYFRIRVAEVDTVLNTFSCEIGMELCWQDQGADNLEEIWRPQFVWQNATGAVQVLSETLDELSNKERLERPIAVANCNVQLVVHAKGTFREPFNLYHFPFDRQYVSIWLMYDSFKDDETRDLFFLDATQGRTSVNSLWKGPARVQTFANTVFNNQEARRSGSFAERIAY
jgi:hypothetical protein